MRKELMNTRMKRLPTGITLLEIMLVLAIAAMIIIMSVRYYQSATQSQQTSSIMQTIQAITAAADQLSQGVGTYSNVTSANLANALPNGLNTPWGSTITVTQAAGQTYTIKIGATPPAVCQDLIAQLSSLSANYQPPDASSCGTQPTDFTYTYSATGPSTPSS